MEEFFQVPREDLIDCYTKDQLLRNVTCYYIEVDDKRLKDTVKSILKANLIESSILMESFSPTTNTPIPVLSFEQQKELLLQLEHDGLKRQQALEKVLEVERLKQETDAATSPF